MSCYSGRDCARAFRTVRANTIQIARDIPVDQWSFRPTPDSMSVREILAHIVAGTTWQLKAHGEDRKAFLTFDDFRNYIGEANALEQSLDTPEAVLMALETEGEAFAAFLESMTDEAMAERVGFPPPVEPSSKTRFELLMSVKEHEMHHRGQLMVYERLVGVVPHLTRNRLAAMAQAANPKPQN